MAKHAKLDDIVFDDEIVEPEEAVAAAGEVLGVEAGPFAEEDFVVDDVPVKRGKHGKHSRPVEEPVFLASEEPLADEEPVVERELADDQEPVDDEQVADERDSAEEPEIADEEAADEQEADDQGIIDVEPVEAVATPVELTDYERSLFGETPIESPAAHAASRRMRKRLLIAIAVVVALILCGVIAGGFVLHKGQKEAEEQTQELTEQVAGQELAGAEKSDVSLQTGEQTDIPELMGLFGKKQDECVKAIGHGATVTATTKVKEEKKDSKDSKKKTAKKTGIDALIKSTATVELSDEPSEEKTGKPTVRLYFDKDGKCIQIGYSAGVSSLGFGALSFADVVKSEHAVENTLRAIGLDVKDGSVKLPEKVNDYTTTKDDGTITKEKCQFKGEKSVSGKDYKWEAVLLYDYTASNATGNLADTVRQMYIYVSKKV